MEHILEDNLNFWSISKYKLQVKNMNAVGVVSCDIIRCPAPKFWDFSLLSQKQSHKELMHFRLDTEEKVENWYSLTPYALPT